MLKIKSNQAPLMLLAIDNPYSIFYFTITDILKIYISTVNNDSNY